MSNDLIAWIVAITLGGAVVGLGLRRNLGETTRNWLPRFGEASGQATAAPDSFDGGQKRRPLSPRQRRWIVWGYLLMGLYNAVLAVVSADDRLLHAIIAIGFAVVAMAFLLKRWPPSWMGLPDSTQSRKQS